MDQPLLLTILFLIVSTGTGYIGEKLVDILGAPIWEWLSIARKVKPQFDSFSIAYENSRRLLLEDQTIQPRVRMRLYDALGSLLMDYESLDEEDQPDKIKLEVLAGKLEGAAFLEDRPDISAITNLLDFIIRHRTKSSFPRHELESAVSAFIYIFQTQLFLQPSFEDLLLKRRQWQNAKEPLYDTRANYLAQVVKQHQSLDFVGIPELKDRNTIQLRDIFIHLQAEASSYASYQNIALEHLQSLSVNNVLRSDKRIVILGDPGAGKTTLLKFITLAYAQNQAGRYLNVVDKRLPLFIRLSDYVAKRTERSVDYSILDYLNTLARENLLLNLEPDFFDKHLSRGECCVCFDGLDELGNIGVRREITSIVESFVNRYSESRVIVTSRIVGYNEAPLDRREFKHYTVLPFGEADIQEFVQKWYNARVPDVTEAQDLADQLIKTILGEPRIKALATNPLLLTIIALVHRIEAELPHERVKLYEKCVGALVDTWEKVKRLNLSNKERPSYKYRRRLLEQIAFWLHSQPGSDGNVRTVKLGSLKLQIVKFLREYSRLQLDEESAWQEAEAFIDLIRSRTGLLIERGSKSGEEVYAFAHLTFQEYLAATNIRKRLIYQGSEAIWEFIQPILHSPRWREVLLLFLGSLNDYDTLPTIIVKRILLTSRSDPFESVLHRHLFLAARALADRTEVSITLHDEIIDELISLVSFDQVGIFEALQILRTFQENEYVINKLAILMKDINIDEWIRIQVVLSIGEIAPHTSSIFHELIAISSNSDEPWDLRYNAAYALGRMGRIDTAVELLEKLEATNLPKLKYYLKTSNLEKLPPIAFDTEIDSVTYVSLDELQETILWYRDRYGYEPYDAEVAHYQHNEELNTMYDYPADVLVDIVKDQDIPIQTRLTAARVLPSCSEVDEKLLSVLLDAAKDKFIDRQLRNEVAATLRTLLAED